MRTEKQTRKEIIDKQLELSGWNINDQAQVTIEYDIYVGSIREPQIPYQGYQLKLCLINTKTTEKIDYLKPLD